MAKQSTLAPKRRARSKPTPVLACPLCGATGREVCWQEWIPSERDIVGVGPGVLRISDCYDDNAEGAKDDSLHCRACGHDWPIPEGIEIEHGDPS